MEQHPIPQNVTKYQFRLIGDMTIKQFIVLGGGILLAFLSYKFPLLPPILKLPVSALLAGAGAAMAFLPYEERTLDVWLINFIKSIYAPTQYLWQKQNVLPDYFKYKNKNQGQVFVPEIPQNDRTQLDAYLKSLKQNSKNPIDKYEENALSRINSLMGQDPTQPFFKPSTKKMDNSIQNTNKNHITSQKTPQANIKTGFLNQQTLTPKSKPHQTQATLRQGVQIFSNKTQNKNQSISSQNISTQVLQDQKSKNNQMAKPNTQQTQTKRAENMIITAAKPLSPPLKMKSLQPDNGNPSKPEFLSDVQMPMIPDAPNTIVGMTLTKNEGLISNAIVEIQDKAGLPTRAVKSNSVGQFFIATPLKNGDYTISTEHSQYTFAKINIKIDGKIIHPIKIVANEES